MPKKHLTADSFSRDVIDFLLLLHKQEVRYLIIGGEAVIFHGYARLTGDMDYFYEATPENAQRLYAALREFWKGNVHIFYLGRGDLIRNKLAAGRPKDLDDVRFFKSVLK